MVATTIQAVERPIGQIFADDYQFVIPRYQRPYSWTTEQAAEMLQDLLSAAESGVTVDDCDPYFLGSIVLVRDDQKAQLEVVDGQLAIAGNCGVYQSRPDLCHHLPDRCCQLSAQLGNLIVACHPIAPNL